MATKYMLVKDKEGLGRSGKIVQVKPGYARNYLLPQGYVVPATPHALRMQVRLQEEAKQRAIAEKAESEAIAQALQGVVITAIVKVDHEGHMYGSVTAHEITDLLQEQAKIALEKRSIILKQPIKQTGEHKVHVRLKEGIEGAFMLTVAAEEATNTNALETKNS
jgi:large subunit ribosomal protein L9